MLPTRLIIGLALIVAVILLVIYINKRKKFTPDEIIKQNAKPVILSSEDIEYLIKRFGGGNNA
jgi:hypothetical protein